MKSVLIRWITSLVAMFVATTAFATVSVEEIIRLHTAGLADHSLLLVVSASDTPDTLSTAQLTQMIEAQVPDTVISVMVAKADAVMEDWQPVNIDEEIDGRTVYTETEVNYVYPSWGGWYGYGGWGWCGTPWYGWNSPWYGYGCAVPYSGLYVGYGWGGGWSVGVNFGWGYNCYDPWYYGGGGYCGFYDPWPGHDPYPGHGDPYYSYRDVDRVDYHSGPSRGNGGRGGVTPYRQDDPITDTRTTLSRMEGKSLTSVDRGKSTTGEKRLRGEPTTGDPVITPGRSIDKLTRVDSQGKDKSTLRSADRGEGRYALKGDDKKLRDETKSSGRTLETVGQKTERSSSLESGTTKSGKAVKSEVQNGLKRGSTGSTGRESDLTGRVTETTRNVTRKAAGAATTGDKVNRYVQMKQAQRTTGGSRGSRTTSSNTRLATAPREASVASGRESAPSSTGRSKVTKSKDSAPAAKAAPSKRSSSPKAISRGGGQRSTGSVGSAPKSGGSFSGGSGTRSGGGGGGSRGGSRGGRR